MSEPKFSISCNGSPTSSAPNFVPFYRRSREDILKDCDALAFFSIMVSIAIKRAKIRHRTD